MPCIAKKTLAIARSGGADVLVQVKENQPELLAMCQMLAQYQSPSQQHVDQDKGHCRIETRMIDTFIPPSEWLPEGWQPLVQAVVKVVRVIEHKRKGKAQTSEETAWGVSTVVLSAAAPPSSFKAPFAAIGPSKTRTIMSVMS
jgi:hypothetical protein